MIQDQHAYQRAANAARVGLVFQSVLSVLLALLGLYAESPALHAATWYFFGGLPIWIILWVYYRQQELERIEAIEAEQLAAADAQTAAIFDEAGQQLQLARRRLENLRKYWLNLVSVLVAMYLVILGTVWLGTTYQGFQPPPALEPVVRDPIGPRRDYRPPPDLVEWIKPEARLEIVVVLLLVLGFVAFLVSRYVAGMTRVRQWELLRGGASYLMGNVVIAVLLLAAAGAAWLEYDKLFPAMALVVPTLMIALGMEIVLSFVLGIYRPRRPGEVVRPAFDSRILGWLTRPESIGKIIGEAINYQFGLEISRSWFYQLLGRALMPLILVAVFVLIALTSVVIVLPQEQAIITTFGGLRAKHAIVEPGLRLKWPWPISRAEKFDAYRVHQIVVGSSEGRIKADMPILWTNEHVEGEEQYLLTAPDQTDSVGLGQQVVAGELIGADLTVRYRVGDLGSFVQTSEDPARLLKAIAERCLNAYSAVHDVDWLLSQGRVKAGRELRRRIQAEADDLDLGLKIVFAGLTGVHPPQKSQVATKFHEKIAAIQEKQTAIENAKRKSIKILAQVAGSTEKAMIISKAIAKLNEVKAGGDEYQIHDQIIEVEKLIDQAGGKAAKLIQEAHAYRWDHAFTEQVNAMQTMSMHEAYRSAPKYFLARAHLMALAEGMKNRRKIITTQEDADIRIEMETPTADLSTLLSETQEQ